MVLNYRKRINADRNTPGILVIGSHLSHQSYSKPQWCRRSIHVIHKSRLYYVRQQLLESSIDCWTLLLFFLLDPVFRDHARYHPNFLLSLQVSWPIYLSVFTFLLIINLLINYSSWNAQKCQMVQMYKSVKKSMTLEEFELVEPIWCVLSFKFISYKTYDRWLYLTEVPYQWEVLVPAAPYLPLRSSYVSTTSNRLALWLLDSMTIHDTMA